MCIFELSKKTKVDKNFKNNSGGSKTQSSFWWVFIQQNLNRGQLGYFQSRQVFWLMIIWHDDQRHMITIYKLRCTGNKSRRPSKVLERQVKQVREYKKKATAKLREIPKQEATQTRIFARSSRYSPFSPSHFYPYN